VTFNSEPRRSSIPEAASGSRNGARDLGSAIDIAIAPDAGPLKTGGGGGGRELMALIDFNSSGLYNELARGGATTSEARDAESEAAERRTVETGETPFLRTSRGTSRLRSPPSLRRRPPRRRVPLDLFFVCFPLLSRSVAAPCSSSLGRLLLPAARRPLRFVIILSK